MWHWCYIQNWFQFNSIIFNGRFQPKSCSVPWQAEWNVLKISSWNYNLTVDHKLINVILDSPLYIKIVIHCNGRPSLGTKTRPAVTFQWHRKDWTLNWPIVKKVILLLTWQQTSYIFRLLLEKWNKSNTRLWHGHLVNYANIFPPKEMRMSEIHILWDKPCENMFANRFS